ncbi:exonuclease domain-containing protein [Melioribacter sp. OK-6-Me]|uniref:exonuclease domain-containing protein n=1 Tax=unclassified Melioribacter TaxID=2627329 RepID=UPI003EDA0BB9
MELTEIKLDKAEYCVFDFETTGASARNERAIEIGIVKIRNKKIINTFSSYINPGKQIPHYITQLTGISDEDVSNAPYFEDIYNKIVEFFGDSILVAHNLKFDYSFLKFECLKTGLELPENPAICTLELAKRIYPELPSKALGSLTRHLKIRHRNVHTGLGDALATAKILIKMFDRLIEEHHVETVSELISFQKFAPTRSYRIIKKSLAEDYIKIPETPGIYFFKDTKDDILYIGKAKSLKKRLSNYFVNNAPRKTKKIVTKANKIDFLRTNTELTALLAEAELIKEHKPAYNKLLKKYSRNYFIRVTSQESFPVVEVTTKFDFDGNDYYGPYPNRDIAGLLKEIIDKTFRLRECKNKEFSKKRKCYLFDIKRCTAPCINPANNEYDNELELVDEFLRGKNQSALDRLLQKMKTLSEEKKFEEAAEIRDVINLILKQLQKASILNEPINKAKTLIEIAGIEKNDYLLLLEGKLVIRNFISESDKYFDEILKDYFDGTIELFKEIKEKDLERLKITLNWLIKNRGKIKIHDLNQINSYNELASKLFFPARD